MLTLIYLICPQALSDIQIAVKMVQSSKDSEEHPLDMQYRSLHCKLDPLLSSSHEYEVCLLLLVTFALTKLSSAV